MRNDRFDQLSRALGASSSRRGVLKILLGGAVGVYATHDALAGGGLRFGNVPSAFAQTPSDTQCTAHAENDHQIFSLTVVSADGGLMFEQTLDAHTPPATGTGGAFGQDTCQKRFVFREAVPGDHVCVTPQTYQQTIDDNAHAAQRRNPAGGLFGPDTCVQGFVFREAVANDHVCVTPETRQQVADDTGQAKERRLGQTSATAGGPEPLTTTLHQTIGKPGDPSTPLVWVDSTASATGFSQVTFNYGDAF